MKIETRDQARALARARLNASGGGEIALYERDVIEKPYGWIFTYQSRRYIETGDPEHMLVGTGPFVVMADGSTYELRSARAAAAEIATFEAEQGL